MSAPAATPSASRTSPTLRRLIGGGVVVVLLVAMALNVKVVKIGSGASATPGAFDPATYGQSQFPKIQSAIEARAVDAATLAAAIAKDPAAAAKQYGIPADIGTEYSVKFTAVVGKGTFGVYYMKIAGVPDNLIVRVQMGPAINGTAVRDATGQINFGQFTNQIDYQNAGSSLNNEIKKQVLAKIDTKDLTGKTVSITGAFQAVVPNSWLITPVKVAVQ
jgi:predicted lipoprotein